MDWSVDYAVVLHEVLEPVDTVWNSLQLRTHPPLRVIHQCVTCQPHKVSAVLLVEMPEAALGHLQSPKHCVEVAPRIARGPVVRQDDPPHIFDVLTTFHQLDGR